MAANINPIFVFTPNIGYCRSATFSTTSDGSGTSSVCFTAGTNGSRVDRITITNAQLTAAASSSMICKIYVNDGAALRLYKETSLPAVTRSTTTIGTTTTINIIGGLILPAGWKLNYSQSVYAGVADQNDIIVEGGDY